jgi:hypothetical protein
MMIASSVAITENSASRRDHIASFDFGSSGSRRRAMGVRVLRGS